MRIRLFKIFIILTVIVGTMLPYVVSAQPTEKYEVVGSELEADENISIDLPIKPPKVKSISEDKHGTKMHINYRATHKVIKTEEIDEGKVYSIVSEIDVPLKVKITKNQNIVQKLFNNIAYAAIGSNDASNQTDYSMIHQRLRLYWNYNDYTDGTRYFILTKQQAWWSRDETRQQVYNAKFRAAMIGNDITQTGGGQVYTYTSPSSFTPTWTSGSSYTESLVVVDPGYSTYSNWPWIEPLSQFGFSGGAIESDIYDSYGTKLTHLNTEVSPH